MKDRGLGVSGGIILAAMLLPHSAACSRRPLSTPPVDGEAENSAAEPDAGILLGSAEDASADRDMAETSTPSDAVLTDTAAVVVAIIDQSASTNARSSEVLVYSDGSAIRTVGPAMGGFVLSPDGGPLPMGPSPAAFPPGSPEGVQFLADLAAVGDVSNIPTSWCPKSVSFGTTTIVWANGKQSGDLQCADAPSPAQAAFISDCFLLSR
jgi:hypothetical protein